ncbi:MAG: hypothetical protein R2834_14100 [Rhodothermales bacterium]
MRALSWFRLSVLALLGALAGVWAGRLVNDYLAIEIADKTLPEMAPVRVEAAYPSLPFRMIDLGGVGIVPDSAHWGSDYSHNKKRFDGVIFAEPPFVDWDAFEPVYAQFTAYVDRMASLGFNAIEMPGFLQYVDFDRVEDGYAVYADSSLYRRRHAAVRAAYGRMFAYAREKGLQVILSTDMVALTTPLEAYFDRRFGGADVENDAFWEVYRQGLAELFERMPEVAGMMIRIGEAGSVYNREGWDYRSELWVRSISSVQKMLQAFTDVAEAYDRTLIFRTWSVGVGQVGRMHTSPEAYAAVLDAIDSDHLIVSTKFTQGDFWNHLPLNPTLFTGRHRRIVEMQARREFEAFTVFPNYVAPLHQAALTRFLTENPRVEGVWVWAQGGGPLRHGPLLIYPFHGLWLWTDANVVATARLLDDPGRPIEDITRAWVTDVFGDDPRVVDALTELLLSSHATAARGLTIPAFARKAVTGMGLEVPPVIYSYWDIVGASTSIFSHVYAVTRGDIDASIDEAFATVDEVRHMRSLLADVSGDIRQGREWVPGMAASLVYEENLLETMAYHKQFALTFWEWIDRGGAGPYTTWHAAIGAFKEAQRRHRAGYQGNLDFPAYNFELVDRSMRQAERTEGVVWAARFLALLTAILLISALRSRRRGALPGWMALHLGVLAGTVMAFSFFDAPAFTLTTGAPMLLYALGLRYGLFRDDPSAYRLAVAPLLAMGLLLLLTLSVRGPFYFWLRFWLGDGFRLALFGGIGLLGMAHLALLLQRAPGGRLQGWGWWLTLTGAGVGLYGLFHLAYGFEALLSRLNDELLLLPGMVSRIMGITTHLNIPLEIPGYLAAIGAGLLATGLLLLATRRRLYSRLPQTT